MAVTTTTIKVNGIRCESCERAIRAMLSVPDGVLAVTLSARVSDVKVASDQTRLGEAALRARLAGLGYEPAA